MQRHVGVLLDQQDSDPLLVDLPDDLEDIAHDQRRQPQRRLIHHDELGAAHQRAGHRQHLLLAAGKGTGLLPVTLLQAREELVAPLDVVVQLIPAQVRADLHIFQHRHIREYPAALRHQRDAALDDLIAGFAQQLLAVVGNGALLCLHLARDGAQGGGFSGAVGADQRNDAALRHLEGNTLDGTDAAVADVQIFYFKHPDPPPSTLR